MNTRIYQLIVMVMWGILNTNASNAVTFQKVYGASEHPAATALPAGIVLTYDGNYCLAGAIGGNNGDLCLAKLNATGDTIWTHTYGGNLRDDFEGFDQTRDSGFILCGSTYTFSTGNTDAYLVRTDKAGNMLWSKNYGGVGAEGFASIRQTADGGFIVLGGPGLVKLDSVGNVTWAKALTGGSGLSVRQTFDKGYILCGSSYGATSSTFREFIAKTDSAGVVIWSSTIGGTVEDGAYSVRQCKDSSYIVTGYTKSFGTGTPDVSLIKLTQSGSMSWMKTYGGNNYDIGYDVEQTMDGGYVVVGSGESFVPDSVGSGYVTYMLKTDALGNLLWSRAHQNSGAAFSFAVKQTPDSGYAIADWRFGFQLTKTDALGRTACVTRGLATVVTTVSPIITTGMPKRCRPTLPQHKPTIPHGLRVLPARWRQQV